MKKTVSILLSLVFMLSMLLAVPAGAATKLNNYIPKTIKMGNITYTGSYNSKNKTLTYNANKSDTSSAVPVYEFLIDAMTQNTTDTSINQDFCDLVDDELDIISLAFNDMVRTGKIKKIIINRGKKHYNYEFLFKTKNNHVTNITFNYSEGDGAGDGEGYTYSYDSKGNVKEIILDVACEAFIVTNGNNMISSVSKYGDIYGSAQLEYKITPNYNEKGYVIGNNTTVETYWDGDLDDNGNLKWSSKQFVDDNGKTITSPKVTFTYMKI